MSEVGGDDDTSTFILPQKWGPTQHDELSLNATLVSCRCRTRFFMDCAAARPDQILKYTETDHLNDGGGISQMALSTLREAET